MPTARLISLALAGATGLALVSPAAAFAAPHAHAKPSHAKHDKQVKDKLSGHRKGAVKQLAAMSTLVRRVAAAEQASTLLSPADKAAVATFDAAALTALDADVAGVAAATSQQGLVAVTQAGHRTFRAVQLVAIVTRAVAADTALLTSLGSSAADVRTAEANLTGDKTAIDTPLADLDGQLAAVQSGLANGSAAALALPASPSKADLAAARADGPSLDALDTSLEQAAADLQAAQDALAALVAAQPTP